MNVVFEMLSIRNAAPTIIVWYGGTSQKASASEKKMQLIFFFSFFYSVWLTKGGRKFNAQHKSNPLQQPEYYSSQLCMEQIGKNARQTNVISHHIYEYVEQNVSHYCEPPDL